MTEDNKMPGERSIGLIMDEYAKFPEKGAHPSGFTGDETESEVLAGSPLATLQSLEGEERVALAQRIADGLEGVEEDVDRNEALQKIIEDNVVFVDSPEASITTDLELLRKPGRNVEPSTFAEAQACVDRLYSALRTRPELAGVAAQQVGFDLNMFLVRINNEELLVVNPRVQKFSPTKNKAVFYESCPSIPGKQFRTVRCCMIKLYYQDQFGKRRERRFKDSAAVVVQHNVDHIRGILVSDHGKEMNPPTERIVEL